MKLKPAGFDFLPQEVYQQQLSAWANGGAAHDSEPPLPARQVLVDDEGNHFVAAIGAEDAAAVPFQPKKKAGTPAGALDQQGGFVPLEDMPAAPPQDSGFDTMMGRMLQQMPQQVALDWVGKAAQQLMTGANPGGMMATTLDMLGVANPLASGPMAALAGGALGAAGLGPLSGALPALGTLLGGAPAAGAAGDPIAQLAGLMTGGGFAGDLDNVSDQMSNIVAGGCTNPAGAGGGIDPNAIGVDALGNAADYLAGQWKVDDESSAAEHIAHEAFNKYKDDIQKALKEELASELSGKKLEDGQGLAGMHDRLKKLFTGVPPGCGLPAIRVSDPDDKGDVSVEGVANILFEKKEVSRVADMVAGAMAPMPGKQIALGEPSVWSGGRPTAFHGVPTAVPSIMQPGACSILVGGAVAAAVKKAMAEQAKGANNAGPCGPEGPKDASSASGGEGEEKKQGAPPAGEGTENTGAKEQKTGDNTAASEQKSSDDASAPAAGSLGAEENTTDSSPRDLAELINGPPEEQNYTPIGNGQPDGVEIRHLGIHSYIVVNKDGRLTLLEAGPNVDNPWFSKNLLKVVSGNTTLMGGSKQENEYDGANDWSHKVEPPAGMSEAEFANRVLAAGDNAIHNNNTIPYAVLGGDGITSGNCQSWIRNVLEDAGADLPYIDIPGVPEPGLNDTWEWPSGTCRPGYPIIVGPPNCDPSNPSDSPGLA